MVTFISTKYECSECGKIFDTHDDCTDHISDECMPEAIEIEGGFECEMCSKEYDDEKKATECEIKHKKKDDLYYGMYIDRIKKAKLMKASQHPEQARLKECS